MNDANYGPVFSQQEQRNDYNTAGEYRVNLPAHPPPAPAPAHPPPAVPAPADQPAPYKAAPGYGAP